MNAVEVVSAWEEEYGKDETYSAEFISGCELCGALGFIDEFRHYDFASGHYYCEYCYLHKGEG